MKLAIRELNTTNFEYVSPELNGESFSKLGRKQVRRMLLETDQLPELVVNLCHSGKADATTIIFALKGVLKKSQHKKIDEVVASIVALSNKCELNDKERKKASDLLLNLFSKPSLYSLKNYQALSEFNGDSNFRSQFESTFTERLSEKLHLGDELFKLVYLENNNRFKWMGRNLSFVSQEPIVLLEEDPFYSNTLRMYLLPKPEHFHESVSARLNSLVAGPSDMFPGCVGYMRFSLDLTEVEKTVTVFTLQAGIKTTGPIPINKSRIFPYKDFREDLTTELEKLCRKLKIKKIRIPMLAKSGRLSDSRVENIYSLSKLRNRGFSIEISTVEEPEVKDKIEPLDSSFIQKLFFDTFNFTKFLNNSYITKDSIANLNIIYKKIS